MSFQDKLKPIQQPAPSTGGFQQKLRPISTPSTPTFDVPVDKAKESANRMSQYQSEKAEYDKEAKKSFLGRFGGALLKNLAPSEVGLGNTISGILLQGGKVDTGLQESIASGGDTQVQLLKQIRENEAKGVDTTKLKQLYNDQEAQLKRTTSTAKSLVQLPTNFQAGGQIAGTALDLLTAGSYSKTARALPSGLLGKASVSPVKGLATAAGAPELGAIAGQKAGGLFSLRGAGNIAKGAGIGYATDVAAGAQGLRGEDREGAKALIPGMGTVLGATIPALSEAGQTVKNIRNPEPQIMSKRAETLGTITKKYAKVDKAVKAANRNNVDAIKILSETNLLNGAVDDDGLLAADRALANFDEFIAPYEGRVREAIQAEGRSIDISQIATEADDFIKASKLPGAAKDQLRAALESDMRGFLIDGDRIPIETLHDTKIFRNSHANYTDTGATAVSKEAARFFKEQVEKNVGSLDVKNYNSELSDYYAIKDVIESLNKTRVQGGRMGKYFSSVIGTGVGGMAGGPVGAIVGAEAGSRIQGGIMKNALGGDIKQGLTPSAGLINASRQTTGKAAIPNLVLPRKAPKIPDVIMGNQSSKVGNRQMSQATTMIPITNAIPKKTTPKAATAQVGIGKLAPKQVKETSRFERAKDLSPKNSAIEAKAFEKINKDEDKIIKDYLAKNGKVVNTDNFRPFFKDVGYSGDNAAAVQEPSSYLGKKAFTKLLAENPEKYVTFLAGGSGSGKTSAVKKLASLSKVQSQSAAVLDSNLSSYSSAIKRIEEVKKAGKKVKIQYVYRDPIESFEQGVVTRMLNNPDEMGRLVPSKVVAGNHIDSFNVVKRLQDEGHKVYFIDNSLGQGKSKLVKREDLEKKVNLPSKEELTKQFNSIAKKLYDDGKITREQYQGYIE